MSIINNVDNVKNEFLTKIQTLWTLVRQQKLQLKTLNESETTAAK